MEVLFEDNDKIIINKEAGQLVQSGRGFDLDLVSEVMNYRRKKGEPAYAAVINRLDRPVSGVVLMAKNKESAAKYSRIMQKQGFCKEYFAVVYGKMEVKKAVLSDYLIKTKDNTAEIADKSCAEAKFAELEYEVMHEITLKNVGESVPFVNSDFAEKEMGRESDLTESKTGSKSGEDEILSLLKITLHTGRFHQIRVQLASRGHAIVGDTKYGNKYYCGKKLEFAGLLSLKPHEIALCAHSLNVDGSEYQVTPTWWDIVTL
jgi:23S rRNA pseudouridine1911/1915/1917 synthase